MKERYKIKLMDKVKNKYKRMLDALTTFQEALENFDQLDQLCEPNTEQFEKMQRALRDSVIKRFEYCTDQIWKYMQLYVVNIHGVALECSGPKNVFRMCLQTKDLSPDEVEQAIEMVECRNHTSYIYKEEIADFVAKKAPVFYTFMTSVMKKMKP